MSHGLLLWLENIDRRRNQVVPLPQKADRETLQALHKTLMVRLITAHKSMFKSDQTSCMKT